MKTSTGVRSTAALFLLVAALLLGAVRLLIYERGNTEWQTADVRDQGAAKSPLATDGAALMRRDDGFRIRVDVPTPTPGGYEYPTGDMIPPWAEAHPAVAQGAADAPEVFTLWVFVFNNPSSCTDDQCDLDDLAPDAPAGGGTYQVDGRIADDDEMHFEGVIRLGEMPVNGVPLIDPHGSEVHVAIAAHGRARTGTDLHRQLNGPVGDPSLWWAATFVP